MKRMVPFQPPSALRSWIVTTIILLFSVTSATYSSARSRCPDSCRSLGSDPAGWTNYHDLQVFQTCNQTILFDTNLYTSISNPETHITIRACSLGDGDSTTQGFSTALFKTRGQYQPNNSTSSTNQPTVTVEPLSLGSKTSALDSHTVPRYLL